MQSWSELRPKSALAALVVPFATKGFYTAFDAINLMDKVLLHEMTHTRAGKETVDVSVFPREGKVSPLMIRAGL